MAPLELEGNSLGEKHKCYNELLKTSIDDYPLDLSPIDFHDSDVNNMLKIEVASRRKNVNYILEVLKSDDMLYVSKAIKNIKWLLTDQEYAHMINPQYLHTQIFPKMTVKAKNKLLLHLRLNLKNENWVEDFFNYYKNTDIDIALKWLPNCSLIFIEKAIIVHNKTISVNILKRLCEKSIKFLEMYLSLKVCKQLNKRKIMKETIFLMNNNLDEYLDILESLNGNDYPMFSAKYTKLLMKKTPQRVHKNFEKYAPRLHLHTLIQYMNLNNISNLLLRNCQNTNLEYWLTDSVLDAFLIAMPLEKRSEFVKTNVIENPCLEDKKIMFCAIPKDSYRWYKYIEFETAFKYMVKLIKAESLPNERMIMLTDVLLFTAQKNMQHIEELLQYFRANHINEPLLYKKLFITNVVHQLDTIRLSNRAWENLNVLFLSIEDTETGIKEQNFLTTAIIRKIINNEAVPEILEKSFVFNTMKLYITKFNEEESDLTFNYLYSYAMKKVNQQNVSSETEFLKAVSILENVLILLSDWKKELCNYPEVVNEITKLIAVKKTKYKDVNISCLYNVKKAWRKCLFPLSLDLSLSQDVYMNALKHDSKLLLDSNHFMDLLTCSDFTNLQKLLRKIRIYWHEAIANEATLFCLHNLKNRGNKALIKHIMNLLPVNHLKEIIVKYIPREEIIDWFDENKLVLNIRKNIAKYLHLGRPQPPIDFVLWYAKGDYLQFAVSSLNSILYNMNEANARKCIQRLIDAPVSLRKHAIRIAIDKLQYEEILPLFRNAWQITENKSIRADLFKSTFKLLCKEKEITAIDSIWVLLDFFMQTLTDKENTVIYNTLTKADEAPPRIKASFWARSIKFFDVLPPSTIQRYYVKKVLYSARDFLDIADPEVLAKVLVENFTSDIFSRNVTPQFIACCILSSPTSEDQTLRYEKIFLPLMKICVTNWDEKKDGRYVYRSVFDSILGALCDGFKHVVLAKQMAVPDLLFEKTQHFLEQTLVKDENYVLLRTWQFSNKLIQIIAVNESQSTRCELDDEELTAYCSSIISKAVPQLGEEIQKCLKEDIEKYYPSIYICLSNAIYSMSRYFNFFNSIELLILKSVLYPDIKESYLLVLDLISRLEDYGHNESIREILETINSHPSREVKFHYYNRRNAKFY